MLCAPETAPQRSALPLATSSLSARHLDAALGEAASEGVRAYEEYMHDMVSAPLGHARHGEHAFWNTPPPSRLSGLGLRPASGQCAGCGDVGSLLASEQAGEGIASAR